MIQRSGSNPSLVHVQFEDVPTISSTELPSTFEAILKARRARRGSYGAYALRGATEGDRSRCLNFLGSLRRGSEIIYREQFGSADDPLPMIHRDLGAKNVVTVHETLFGAVEGAILVGSKRASGSGDPVVTVSQEADFLLDKKTLDTTMWTAPVRALRAQLGERDLLLFDNTQPHVFRNVTPVRISEGHYLTRPAW